MSWNKRGETTGLKYIKCRDRFENSTGSLTYYPLTRTAYSYDHWVLFKPVNEGKALLFNDYTYSSTTGRHVRFMRDYLRKTLSLPIIYVYSSKNIKDDNSEQRLYDEAYLRLMISKRILLANDMINKIQLKKAKEARDSAQKFVDELATKFSYVPNLDKNHKQLVEEATRLAINQVDTLVNNNSLAAKARKEKYYKINPYRLNFNNHYDKAILIQHPFFEMDGNDLFMKDNLYVLKKDYKAIVNAREFGILGSYQTRHLNTSVAEVPKDGELITVSMIPSIYQAEIRNDISSVIEGEV